MSSLGLCGRDPLACLDVTSVTQLPGGPTQLYPLNRGLLACRMGLVTTEDYKACSYGNVLGAGDSRGGVNCQHPSANFTAGTQGTRAQPRAWQHMPRLA